MRAALAAVALAASGAALAAEPIFVPDFTPGTQAEFTATVMIQGLVTDRLLADGYIVLGNDVVAPAVGAHAVTNCAALPSCPLVVLPQLPTRVAVVVRVGRVADGLSAHFELWEQSRPTPVLVHDLPLPPGGERTLADDVSASVAWLVGQLGPSPDPVILAAARMLAGQGPSAAPPPRPVPVPPPMPVPTPVVAPPPRPMPPPRPVQVVDLDDPSPTRPGVAPKAVGPVAGLGEESGVYDRHVAGSIAHFEKAAMDPRDWVYRYTPHAGRVIFEARAGLAIGDADRGANLRVEVEGGELKSTYFIEGPKSARRPRGALFIGYAPITAMDIGVLGGLQYGQRHVTTGVANVDSQELTRAPTGVADAITLYVQPRIRVYPVPLGPAKPYLFTGGDIRVFNEYDIDQPEAFKYPVPPGGVVGGWIGGGGILLDPSPIVGFFFEPSYTQHFGERAGALQSGVWAYETIAEPIRVNYTIGLAGGVQFRI